MRLLQSSTIFVDHLDIRSNRLCSVQLNQQSLKVAQVEPTVVLDNPIWVQVRSDEIFLRKNLDDFYVNVMYYVTIIATKCHKYPFSGFLKIFITVISSVNIVSSKNAQVHLKA